MIGIVCLSLYARLGVPEETKTKEVQKRSPAQIQKTKHKKTVVVLEVIGEGAAPPNSISPAQALILAKRAALADAYRKMSERVAGVMIEGEDKVENMIVMQSTVHTKVQAILKNATIVDTKCENDICEVKLELRLYRKTDDR